MGAFGSSPSLVEMLSKPGFLPDDVSAKFVGVPFDLIEEIQDSFIGQHREVELTPHEPRHVILYKPMPEMLEKLEQ